jgi:hypothetical protein
MASSRRVAAVEQFLADPGPVLTAIRHQILDGHPVDARRPTVAHYPVMSRQQILTAQRFLHE